MIARIVLMGVVATLATDLWQRLLLATVGLPATNWGLVGRWVGWFPRGVFAHYPITATAPIRGEHAIGWAFHYFIGIFYALVDFAILRLALDSDPTILSALVFALALLAAPWFVMQPALGLGVMAARTEAVEKTCWPSEASGGGGVCQ